MSTDKRGLDNPRNITRIVYGLYALCVALLIADLLYVKHVHFTFERVFGFFAAFGFVAYVSIVMSAKLLRRLLSRPEDYYERSNAGDAKRGGAPDA